MLKIGLGVVAAGALAGTGVLATSGGADRPAVTSTQHPAKAGNVDLDQNASTAPQPTPSDSSTAAANGTPQGPTLVAGPFKDESECQSFAAQDQADLPNESITCGPSGNPDFPFGVFVNP